MSEGVTILPGSLPNPTGFVFFDFPRNPIAPSHSVDRTVGQYAAVQLPVQPTSASAWVILGFSVQVRMAIYINGVTPPYWARLGDLWAGLLIDRPAVQRNVSGFARWGPADFPPDVSMMTKIWDGSTDPITTINSSTGLDTSNFHLISEVFSIPFPVTIRPGSQLYFGLILTPSILDTLIYPAVLDCEFSVIYTPRDTTRK